MAAKDIFAETKEASKSLAVSAKHALSSFSFQIIALVPFLTFLTVELLYSLGFLAIPSVCILVTIFGVVASWILMLMWRRGALFGPVGFSCCAAVLIGTLLGLFFYDQYAIFPKFYRNSAIYANVVPTQPSAAVADAGKIVFTHDSTVDTNHSVGFITEQGSTYCAAPIRDNNPMTRVEFWAVGIDCCGELGDFTCDSAGNPDAHAGIVVFDNNGFFTSSRHDYYDKARLKAEAQWSLLSRPSPLYVRWVAQTELTMLENYYTVQLIVALVVTPVLYLGASCGLAFLLYKPGGPRAETLIRQG